MLFHDVRGVFRGAFHETDEHGTGELSLSMADFLKAGFNLLPVVLFFTALAALLLGAAPRLGKLTYGYLGYSFMISYFSGVLTNPKWLLKTSAFNWLPHMPVESFSLAAFLATLAAAVALTLIGAWAYSHRDMHEGA